MKNRELYSADWHDKIRPQIMKRDNYQCRICHARQRTFGYHEPNGHWVECDELMIKWAVECGKKVVQMFVQVAHVDQNPSNNNPHNLVTLCPRHHLKLDRDMITLLKKLPNADKLKLLREKLIHSVLFQSPDQVLSQVGKL